MLNFSFWSKFLIFCFQISNFLTCFKMRDTIFNLCSKCSLLFENNLRFERNSLLYVLLQACMYHEFLSNIFFPILVYFCSMFIRNEKFSMRRTCSNKFVCYLNLENAYLSVHFNNSKDIIYLKFDIMMNAYAN